jgi:hypothetical protein
MPLSFRLGVEAMTPPSLSVMIEVIVKLREQYKSNCEVRALNIDKNDLAPLLRPSSLTAVRPRGVDTETRKPKPPTNIISTCKTKEEDTSLGR